MTLYRMTKRSLVTHLPNPVLVPTDIVICYISSHAQVEALVQLAEQKILHPSERQPFVTQRELAVYGDSLALER
jgi:hypothetical protein